ncbi:TLR adapter interacting with SLC15A4 on the lysosome-like [Mixophyes fleayi]|uniref:TLR adapter interacting with SLC15A4 on the lysosome-like n=1 Tax=Mixophyes fleayi TaxID=3061075 RepID=UPI003F4E2EAF
MLAEAFLSTVMYRETMAREDQQDRENDNALPSWQDRREKSLEKKVSENFRESSDRREDVLGEPVIPFSQAMCIPKRDKDNSLDLYTSWSSTYGSIYRNYPDLHIGGDHILNNKKDSGCVLDLESEFQDGPVLLSVDIDSSSPPGESLAGPLVEGVLHSEESNLFPSAPFSNSVLNGFLEKKMQELYKQCIEENLVTNASPNHLLWSSILKHNVHQLSMQISQEHNVGHSRAKEAILQCLCSATSSEFITPILLISKQETKKQSGTLSNNVALKKNCTVHSKI